MNSLINEIFKSCK